MEIVKAGLALVVAGVSLFFADVVGRHLGSRWDEARRQRELDTAALTSFYRLYGEFFAVWKEWSTARPRAGDNYIRPQEDVAWPLLQRACAVEGGLEGLLVKLALERLLTDPQLRDLARFRQSYQSLRESIRADKDLGWRARPGEEDGSLQYVAFKHLAAEFAQLLVAERGGPPVEPGAAGHTLEKVTNVGSRPSWWVG